MAHSTRASGLIPGSRLKVLQATSGFPEVCRWHLPAVVQNCVGFPPKIGPLAGIHTHTINALRAIRRWPRWRPANHRVFDCRSRQRALHCWQSPYQDYAG